MDYLTLERFAYLDKGTLGKILELNIYTLERPWLDNVRYESSIPEGVYDVRPDEEGRWTGYPELQNVPGRTEIIIHPANQVEQLEGCIAPGLQYVIAQKLPAVYSSRLAMARIQEHGDFTLTITAKRAII